MAPTGVTTVPPTLLDAGDVTITVKDVKNPTNNYANIGLGNFGISTYSTNTILVDKNMNFGSLALSEKYTNFKSVLV